MVGLILLFPQQKPRSGESAFSKMCVLLEAKKKAPPQLPALAGIFLQDAALFRDLLKAVWQGDPATPPKDLCSIAALLHFAKGS